MQRRLESLLLSSRWLLLPLYLILLAAMVAIYASVIRETIHLFAIMMTASDIEIVLLVLALLDLVLVANLLFMVALSSYESTISPIDVADGDRDRPDWLGRTSSGDIKVKVSVSIVMISVIHLLRAYMNNAPTTELVLLGAVHPVFITSTVALGYANRAKS